jgi:predicted O-methyltransferase YrrM
MRDLENIKIPESIQGLLLKTEAIGFQMVSEPLVGSLLRTLAMSKPFGRFLELGTGTGVSTAWILNGMDSQSTLLTIENDAALVAIAQEHLGKDSRVEFHVEDGGAFMKKLSSSKEQFDMIFADTWAGKYTHFEEVMQVLKPSGLYVRGFQTKNHSVFSFG